MFENAYYHDNDLAGAILEASIVTGKMIQSGPTSSMKFLPALENVPMSITWTSRFPKDFHNDLMVKIVP